MSEHKAEPGRFYKATVRGEPAVAVVLGGEDGWDKDEWMSAVRAGGRYFHPSSEVSDIRPLVVLDLDGAAEVARDLRAAAKRVRAAGAGYAESSALNLVAQQIEAQTKPPKPPEPKNFAAVVVDANGSSWSRYALDHMQPWVSASCARRAYEDIDVTSVEYEGVPS